MTTFISVTWVYAVITQFYVQNKTAIQRRILVNAAKATLREISVFCSESWDCVMICCRYLLVSESCPLLSLRYLPTRHTQLDKCFVWPSKFVFLPLNCDFISLGQARHCAPLCVYVHVWMCLLIFSCFFFKLHHPKDKTYLFLFEKKNFHQFIIRTGKKENTVKAKEFKALLKATGPPSSVCLLQSVKG